MTDELSLSDGIVSESDSEQHEWRRTSVEGKELTSSEHSNQETSKHAGSGENKRSKSRWSSGSSSRIGVSTINYTNVACGRGFRDQQKSFYRGKRGNKIRGARSSQNIRRNNEDGSSNSVSSVFSRISGIARVQHEEPSLNGRPARPNNFQIGSPFNDRLLTGPLLNSPSNIDSVNENALFTQKKVSHSFEAKSELDDSLNTDLLEMIESDRFEEVLSILNTLVGFDLRPNHKLVDALFGRVTTPPNVFQFIYEKCLSPEKFSQLIESLLIRRKREYDSIALKVVADNAVPMNKLTDSAIFRLFEVIKEHNMQHLAPLLTTNFINSGRLNQTIVLSLIKLASTTIDILVHVISLIHSWAAMHDEKIRMAPNSFISVFECFTKNDGLFHPKQLVAFNQFLSMVHSLENLISSKMVHFIFSCPMDLFQQRILVLRLVTLSNCEEFASSNPSGPFCKVVAKHFNILCLGGNPAFPAKLFHLVKCVDPTYLELGPLRCWISSAKRVGSLSKVISEACSVYIYLSRVKREFKLDR